MKNLEFITQLEAFVDQNSLSDALELLSEIAWEKADHIEHDWQDRPLARRWELAGGKLDAFRDKFQGVDPTPYKF